jgi:hypothetical protein
MPPSKDFWKTSRHQQEQSRLLRRDLSETAVTKNKDIQIKAKASKQLRASQLRAFPRHKL